MADFANIITLVSGNLPGENRADTLRGRGTGGTDRRRCRCGGRAGPHHRCAAGRDGWLEPQPHREPRPVQCCLPGGGRAGGPTGPAEAHHPDPARPHPILPRPSALEHLERPGIQPRFRGVQSRRAPQHLPQSAVVPGSEKGADADQRRRVRHREGLAARQPGPDGQARSRGSVRDRRLEPPARSKLLDQGCARRRDGLAARRHRVHAGGHAAGVPARLAARAAPHPIQHPRRRNDRGWIRAVRWVRGTDRGRQRDRAVSRRRAPLLRGPRVRPRDR